MPFSESLKKEIRASIAADKKRYSAEQLEVFSISIWEKIVELDVFKKAENIILYYSLDGEVHTHSFIEEAIKTKKVFLPVAKGNGVLSFRLYNKKVKLIKSAFGVMEPDGEDISKFDTIKIAIIPGVAFDEDMNRLGYGKGYYDRFLANHPSIIKIGVCFDFQLKQNIPSSHHDIPMDYIITPTHTLVYG